MIILLSVSALLMIDYMVYKKKRGKIGTYNGVINSADLIAALRK